MATSSGFQFGLFSDAGLDSIDESTARINIWEGAVRSGKTIGSIVRWLEYVKTAPPGDLMMLGKTVRTLESNILNVIETMVGPGRWRYNQGRGEARLFGRRILIRGANDAGAEAKVRGATLAGWYGDEITLWPDAIFRQLLARMSVKGAKCFGTTNPDSPFHWLKVDFLDKPGLDLKQFHFRLEDNWNLDPDYVANLKKEYTGLWYKRFILGLWVQAEGAIYDMFDPDIHVISELPDAWASLVTGVDYGTANPTAFINVGYDPVLKRWVAFSEYYYDSRATGRQKTDAQYASDFKGFLGGLHPQSVEVDPSAASFKAQLRADKIASIRDAQHEVLDGIRTVGRVLTSGELVIHESCRHLIAEMSNYSWDETAQKRGEDKPVKAHDHACFIAGTMVVTSTGAQPIETIQPGDLVLTRDGFQHVTDAGMTAINAEVLTVSLSNGVTLTGTRNHPVWVRGCGWTRLGTLRYGAILESCEANVWFTTESPSGATPIPSGGPIASTSLQASPISSAASIGCIKRSGRRITARFHQITTSIIGMATRSTTTSLIWIAFLLRIIPRSILAVTSSKRSCAFVWTPSGLFPSSGTAPTRAAHGIASTASAPGSVVNLLSANVRSVASHLSQSRFGTETDSAPMPASPHGGAHPGSTTSNVCVSVVAIRSRSTATAKRAPAPVFVLGVSANPTPEPVYNLTVENASEYYAGGVLVHNCDALRYAVMRIFGRSGLAPVALPKGRR